MPRNCHTLTLVTPIFYIFDSGERYGSVDLLTSPAEIKPTAALNLNKVQMLKDQKAENTDVDDSALEQKYGKENGFAC